MKKAITTLLCLMCACCLYAAPAATIGAQRTNDIPPKVFHFKDVANSFYSARDLGYTDGGFLGQSGSLEIKFSDKCVEINVLYEGEGNPRTLSIAITKQYVEMDSKGNELSVYKGYFVNDTTRAPIYFKMGQKYATLTRAYYNRLFYDFDGRDIGQEKVVTIFELYSLYNYENTSDYLRDLLQSYTHEADVLIDFYTHDSKEYRLSNLDGIVKLELTGCARCGRSLLLRLGSGSCGLDGFGSRAFGYNRLLCLADEVARHSQHNQHQQHKAQKHNQVPENRNRPSLAYAKVH